MPLYFFSMTLISFPHHWPIPSQFYLDILNWACLWRIPWLAKLEICTQPEGKRLSWVLQTQAQGLKLAEGRSWRKIGGLIGEETKSTSSRKSWMARLLPGSSTAHLCWKYWISRYLEHRKQRLKDHQPTWRRYKLAPVFIWWQWWTSQCVSLRVASCKWLAVEVRGSNDQPSPFSYSAVHPFPKMFMST